MYDVLKYIHDNIKNPLSVPEVSQYFGYSKWSFCKKFHNFAGMTFVDYVRHYRIQLAAIDILSGVKITDVAFSYGYDTVGGFNKAFLKEYGCFPREYKKQAKECQLYYERRQNSMFRLSDRCNMLREEAVNLKSYNKKYCVQRNVYFSLGGAEAAEKNLETDEIYAAALSNTIRKFTPFIAPGELITGFNYGDGDFEETYIPKNNEADIKLMRENSISEEDIKKYFSIDEKYSGIDFIYGSNLNPLSYELLTEEEKQAEKEWSALGRCTCHNHSVIGYEKVLKLGFSGLIKEIEAYEKKNGGCSMYCGAKDICSAALTIGEKYADETKRLIAENNPAYSKEDLEKIIKICQKVPKYPAESFIEAVQSLWFAHIINTWEDCINANSLGRLDQMLYPYYKADIEKGVLTQSEAYEIIACLWIKLYRDYDVQQSCVGGTNSDGKSVVNELSYMMLDVTERLDFVRCLSVRYSQNTETEFLKRALEVVGHVQKGIPFFFNDDVMVPALMYKNIAKEDAYNYTQLGCVETLIPGKTNPHAVTGKTNLLKAIEYVLGNGSSLMYPEFLPGIKTGDLSAFGTYEKFYSAVIKQVDRILDLTCSQVKKHCDTCISPKPYKSLLTEGCLDSKRDYNNKGAVYDYYQIMLGGIPNLADSLAVIKKFIYKEKKYTLEELKAMLINDFSDEAVRLEFINKASKFGNDIDEVDDIAVELVNHCCDELERLSEKYEYSFHAQPFTFLWMIDYGKHSTASPDGRKKGDPIAYSVSPMQGRDINGLTAVLNSISKFPTKRTPGTTSAIVEVDPKLFTDKNIGLLTSLLVASGKNGLSNVQFNTVDADTLIDAKKHPENHRNLAVRVSGFSQKFSLLTPELQEHIIERTKHFGL